MSDGDWEAFRGSHRDAKGNADSEHAAAAAGAGAAGSRVKTTDEVIIGWRVWGVSSVAPPASARDTPRPFVLTSTFMTDVWQPGRAMTACCGTKFLRHGIHAFKTPDAAQAYIAEGLKPVRYVFGEVSLWGRVVVHEHGYRAEYAYPKRLFVPRVYQGGRDYVNEFRRSYGVEVEWTT